MTAESSSPRAPAAVRGSYRQLPRDIWALGFVSMFMDVSSELIHSLLPIFMLTLLGASVATIGVLEGLAEATAAVTKVFSGAISDYFRKRKALAVAGYALSALTKPIFPLATTVGWVFAARMADRVGKGIRGAPRDALVAEIAPVEIRGAAFGLRQALDSVGAFLGPLLALGLMVWLANDIKTVLWVAVVPAFLSVLLLLLGVQEPETSGDVARAKKRLTWSDLKHLSRRYWLVVGLGAVFTLARFSEAFLILRAQDVGVGVAYVPAILIVMNIAYSLVAYPAGAAADRLSASTLLLIGLAMLIAADLVLAIAASPAIAFLGAALWGLHMAFTQGLLSKLVADNAPGELRGTAFGFFNLVSGGALLLASVIAGALWSTFGAAATFVAGASFAALAALGILLFRPTTRTRESGATGLAR